MKRNKKIPILDPKSNVEPNLSCAPAKLQCCGSIRDVIELWPRTHAKFAQHPSHVGELRPNAASACTTMVIVEIAMSARSFIGVSFIFSYFLILSNFTQNRGNFYVNYPETLYHFIHNLWILECIQPSSLCPHKYNS